MTHPRNAQPAGADAEKAAFLRDLRALRDQAGLQTSDLAARAHYPEDTLRAAEDGPALPSLPVLEAYVRGCGAQPSDWEERWRRVALMPAEELEAPLPTRAPSGNRLPTRAPSAGPVGLSAAEKAALAPGLARVAAGLGPTTVAAEAGSWFARPDMVTTESGSPPPGSSAPPETAPAAPDSGAAWRTPDPGTSWPPAEGGAARPSADGGTRPFTERGGARPFADGGTRPFTDAGAGRPESGAPWPPPRDRAPAWPASQNGPSWPGAADRTPSWPGATGSGGPVSGSSVSGGPVSGGPVSGGPVSGGPVSGGPVSGGPVSGGSAFGGSAQPGRAPHSRTSPGAAGPGGAGPGATDRGPAGAGRIGDRGRTGRSTAPLNASDLPATPGAKGRPAGRTMALVVLSVVALLIVAALLWLALKP
jgi:hypothetical protein